MQLDSYLNTIKNSTVSCVYDDPFYDFDFLGLEKVGRKGISRKGFNFSFFLSFPLATMEELLSKLSIFLLFPFFFFFLPRSTTPTINRKCCFFPPKEKAWRECEICEWTSETGEKLNFNVFFFFSLNKNRLHNRTPLHQRSQTFIWKRIAD